MYQSITSIQSLNIKTQDMKKFTLPFLILFLTIGMAANAQIHKHKLNFKNFRINYESVTAKNVIDDYYIIFFENDSSASFKYLKQNKCFKHNANYYLINVSTLKLTDDEKNDLLNKFVETIDRNSRLSNATLHVVSNVERRKIPSLMTRSGLHIFITETIEPLCWPVAGETKTTVD